MSKKPRRNAKSLDTKCRSLAQSEYARLAEFRHLLRQFLIFSESAAAAAGLAAQQHQALLAIKGFGMPALATTTGRLAESLGIRHHSAVGLIDRLTAKGLVRRRRDTNDRRRVLIDLTRKADSLLERLSVAHRGELGRLAPLLRDLLAHFERPGTSARRDSGSAHHRGKRASRRP